MNGDPYLANLVSNLLWIDFRNAKVRTDSPIGFIESLLGHKPMSESLRDKDGKYKGRLDVAIGIIDACRQCSVDA